ncbi:MAG: branched-chain amino acid ABC transporter permease [Rhodobacteraceae bacterium]|nr:branched-chain amino acid ABC transporter permease [Paracoccaceae bacterium]
MLGLSKKDASLLIAVAVLVALAPIFLNPFPENSALAQFNAGYPDLMQRFVIFGIFAIGFNILFGLTGYLSFGHAAFLGAGSYAGVWMLKLLTVNVIPAILISTVVAGLFAILIGYISLRRSGIYFSILTLAFAQMSFALAASVLTPITGGETGLQTALNDPRILDGANDGGNIPAPNFFGLEMGDSLQVNVAGWLWTFNAGYYIAGIIMLISFYVAIRIFRSPFGMMLRAIKSNQQRLNYTGLNTRPYMLACFVISHKWFSFLPDGLEDFVVTIIYPFIGKGWHLTLGLMFMGVIIFLPGGLVELGQRISRSFSKNKNDAAEHKPAE